MPQPENLTKAYLQEIEWDNQGNIKREGRIVKVQFNPETLKVAFSNQIAGGDQRGGAAIQFSGRGTTKLSFDLWFDVNAPNPDTPNQDDVRLLTRDIGAFMKVEQKKKGKKTEYIPPGTRFVWGSFLFEGVMESMNESLEFFSEEGKPLRASLSVSLMKQDVEFRFGEDLQTRNRASRPPGTSPQQQARQDESLQEIAAREGRPEDWPQTARDNNIEDPLRVPAGTPIST